MGVLQLKLAKDDGDWCKNHYVPFGCNNMTKLAVIHFTRGFVLYNQVSAKTTLITCCPGKVKTKPMLEFFGDHGIEVKHAAHMYLLATQDKFQKNKELPSFYSGI